LDCKGRNSYTYKSKFKRIFAMAGMVLLLSTKSTLQQRFAFSLYFEIYFIMILAKFFFNGIFWQVIWDILHLDLTFQSSYLSQK